MSKKTDIEDLIKEVQHYLYNVQESVSLYCIDDAIVHCEDLVFCVKKLSDELNDAQEINIE